MKDRVDTRQEFSKITQHLQEAISQEHNDIFLKPIEIQEMEEEMQQMTLGNSPRPYGFTSNFSIIYGTS